MSLPAQHHAVAGLTPNSIAAANHTSLSSLAAANQLEVPVCDLCVCPSACMAVYLSV